MKNTFANIITFAALCVAFSSFTACNSASTQPKGPIIEVASNDANAATDTGKGSVSPPTPVAIMQSDIKDLEGKTFKLEDKKGKVVLVNLWATWCGPCRSEMPHLVEMQEKYKDKNFEVLGLDVDEESVEAVKSFGEQMKLNYPLGFADEKLVSEFIKLSRKSGIPQSFLINREGRTAGIFFGAAGSEINKLKAAIEKTVNE